MRRIILVFLALVLPSPILARSETSRPAPVLRPEWKATPEEIDDEALLLDLEPAAADTQWIVDWSFDGGNPCHPMGWTALDLRAPSSQPMYWHVGNAYDTVGGVVGNAAILSHHDLCWAFPDGYGNDWYQAIAVRYRSQTLLSADFRREQEDRVGPRISSILAIGSRRDQRRMSGWNRGSVSSAAKHGSR